MVYDYIDLPGAYSTGTSEVRLHCGTDMLTMVRISDMEPYPAPRGYVELARKCQRKMLG